MKTSYGPRHDNFSTDHLVDIFADQFLGGISVQVEAFVVIFFFLACVLCHRRLAPPLFQFFSPFHILRVLRDRLHSPSVIDAHAG